MNMLGLVGCITVAAFLSANAFSQEVVSEMSNGDSQSKKEVLPTPQTCENDYFKIARELERDKHIGGVTAMGSTVSGLGGAYIIVTAANGWNPVGWGMAAVGGVGLVSAGIGGAYYSYKLKKGMKPLEDEVAVLNLYDDSKSAQERIDAHKDPKYSNDLKKLFGEISKDGQENSMISDLLIQWMETGYLCRDHLVSRTEIVKDIQMMIKAGKQPKPTASL